MNTAVKTASERRIMMVVFIAVGVSFAENYKRDIGNANTFSGPFHAPEQILPTA
jgi:hypothetical protein